jgi:type IV secretion system protein VirD4
MPFSLPNPFSPVPYFDSDWDKTPFENIFMPTWHAISAFVLFLLLPCGLGYTGYQLGHPLKLTPIIPAMVGALAGVGILLKLMPPLLNLADRVGMLALYVIRYSVGTALSLVIGRWLGGLFDAPMAGMLAGVAVAVTSAIFVIRFKSGILDRAIALKFAHALFVPTRNSFPFVVAVMWVGVAPAALLGGFAAAAATFLPAVEHYHASALTVAGALLKTYWLLLTSSNVTAEPQIQLGGALAAAGVWFFLTKDTLTAPTNADIQGDAPRSPEPVYGSARAATVPELIPHNVDGNMAGGIYVGVGFDGQSQKNRFLVYSGENSAILVAPSGSGKMTCSLAYTLLLNTQDNIVVYDPKGELAAITGRQRASLHHTEIIIFNPFGTLPGILPKATASYNPVASLDPDSDTFPTDAALQADVLIALSVGDQNPFFVKTARLMVAAVIMYDRITEGKNASLPRVYELLNQDEKNMGLMFLAMQQSKCQAVKQVGLSYGTPEQLASNATRNVLATIRSEMNFLNTPVMTRLFSGDSPFDFNRLKTDTEKRFTVYIVFPAKEGKAFSKASELLIAAAVNAVMVPPKTRTLLIVDEAATALTPCGGGIQKIREAFSLGRGYGLRVQMVVQSWPQLLTMFPNEKTADELAASAGLIQFYGANDSTTADVIRKNAGQKTIWSLSSNPFAPFGIEGSVGGEGVNLLTDQAIRGMQGNGSQIVFLLGSENPAVLSRKPPYHEVKAINALADPNPYFEGDKYKT